MAEMSRLRWMCRRGMKELDVVLTRYLDERYSDSSDTEQALFQQHIVLAVAFATGIGPVLNAAIEFHVRDRPDHAIDQIIDRTQIRLAAKGQLHLGAFWSIALAIGRKLFAKADMTDWRK